MKFSTRLDSFRSGCSRLMAFVLPPAQWKVPVILVLGILTGLAVVIFHVSNASSYLSDDPRACINCHVMTPQYATWQRGSHGRNITCNDCHVPHDNPIRSYAFKAQDGMRHAYIFTFRLEPQVITMHEAGRSVVQENCIRCHEHLVGGAAIVDATAAAARHGAEKLCWDCHRETPHGRVHSLASAPYARIPLLSSVLPPWIDSLLIRNHPPTQRVMER
jgi:cytochrome c nitrite reductase small subunit